LSNDIEGHRQNVQPFQTDARALVRYIADAAGIHAGPAGEEQESAPIDARPSDLAAFYSALLKHSLNPRHRFSSFCVVVFDETFVNPPSSIMTAPYPAAHQFSRDRSPGKKHGP
jgi:hypothetical protein